MYGDQDERQKTNNKMRTAVAVFDKLNKCNNMDVKMEETVGKLLVLALISMVLIIMIERMNLYFFQKPE